MDAAVTERLFSQERFAPYLAAGDGAYPQALLLYRWNVELTAAFFELIAFVEVATRNACAEVLTKDQLLDTGVPWYLDRNVLSRPALEKVDATRSRVYDEFATESPGRIVAGLTFGFWRGLFDRKNEQLWVRSLHKAFPHGDGKRSTISKALSGVHPFRNRLAHHEPIFHLHERALDRRRNELGTVAEALSPDFAAWLGTVDRTTAIRSLRPETASQP
jgi:hypothetical protein